MSLAAPRTRAWFTEPWRTDGAGRHLILGVALGLGIFTISAVVLWVGGWQDITRSDTTFGDLAITTLTGAVAAPVLEEVVFRYLIFRGLERIAGSWIAMAISAIGFGLLRLPEPAAGPTGAAAIAISGGVLLPAAYLATRTMWLPIAVHAGANLGSVVLFGVATPGAHRLFTLTPHGPTALSGGDYGLDASLITVALSLLAALPLLVAARRRNNLIPMRRPGQAQRA